MCKGQTQQSTTSSQPNPQVLGEYNNVINGINNLAGTSTFQQYPGQLTAGLTSGEQNAQNYADGAGSYTSRAGDIASSVSSNANSVFGNAGTVTDAVSPYFGSAAGTVGQGLGNLSSLYSGLGSTYGAATPGYVSGFGSTNTGTGNLANVFSALGSANGAANDVYGTGFSAANAGLGNLTNIFNALGSFNGSSTPEFTAGAAALGEGAADTRSALNSLGNIQSVQPYFDQGATLAQQGAGTVTPQQFSSDALQPFLYSGQKDLVDATMAVINKQNAQQQSNIITQAIGAGNAFGGDRMGVAQSNLALNQDLASNQTLAQLNSANYNNAVAGFQSQRDANVAAQENNYARQLQAAGTLGSLGSASMSAQLAPIQMALSGAAQMGNLGTAYGNLGTAYQTALMAPSLAQAGIAGQQLNAASTYGNLGSSYLSSLLAPSQAQASVAAQQIGAGTTYGNLGSGYQTALQSPYLAQAGIAGQQMGAGSTLSGIGTAALGSYLQPMATQLSALGTNLNAGQQNLGASSAMLGQSAASLAQGQVEQNTNQNALTNAYNQFLLQQQYPFQLMNFVSGAASSLGSGLGGTSTTTSPGPSLLGQIAGIGLAGASLLKKYGGRVPERAAGGRVNSPKGFASGGVAMPGVGISADGLPYGGLAQIQIIPSYSGARMSGMSIPTAPAPTQQANPLANLATGSAAGNSQLKGLSNIGNFFNTNLGNILPTSGWGSAGNARGGRIMPKHGHLGNVVQMHPRSVRAGAPGSLGNLALKHYDDGGAVTGDDGPVFDASILGGAPTSYTALGPASGGVSAIPDSYISRVAQIESSGNPNAVSPTGAKGLLQFTSGTARAVGLENPFDPAESAAAGKRLAASNRAILAERLNRDPTEAELYLAHQQGAGGAAAMLNNPTARAGDIVGDRAVRVNGGDPNMPAGAFAKKWLDKYDGTTGGPDTTGSVGSLGNLSSAANTNRAAPAAPTVADPSIRQALLAAGLGMMASRSHFALQAIGEGGLAGLANYRGQQEMAQKGANTQSEINSRTAATDQGQQRIGLEYKSLAQRADQAAKELKLHQQAQDQQGANIKSEIGLRDVQAGAARYTRTMTPAGIMVVDNLDPSKARLIPWTQLSTPDVPVVPGGGAPDAAPVAPQIPDAPVTSAPAASPGPSAPSSAPASPAVPPAPAPAPASRPYTDEMGQTIEPPQPAPAATPAPAPAAPRAVATAAPAAPARAAPAADAAPSALKPVLPPANIPMDPLLFSPTGQGIAAEQTKKALDASKQAYDASQTTKVMLGQMQHDLAQLPKTGLLTAGPGFSDRAALAGRVNQVLRGFGVGEDSLVNPNAVASAEELKKLTNRMGFDLAKSMGGREPGFIVQQAVGSVPGGDNSPMGAQRLIAGIQAMAQRQEDYHLFLEKWASQTGGSTTGADAYFNKVSPPSKYVAQAVISTIPPGAVDMLRKNPALAASFNAKYGAGTSSYVLGQ